MSTIRKVIEQHRGIFDPLHLLTPSQFLRERIVRAAEGKLEDRLFFANLLEAIDKPHSSAVVKKS